jgi:type III pantothenate kinase
MQSGVLYGYASMVDGLISKIKKEVKNDNLNVVATGGLISIIAPLCNEKIDVIEPSLLLIGLYKIYLKNI